MEFRLLKHQAKLYKNFREYDCSPVWAEAIVAGFGSGKTYTLTYTGLLAMLEAPGTNIGVYSSTFDLLKLTNIPAFEHILTKHNIKFHTNKGDMIMYLPQLSSQIIFRSMDNPARIIAYEHGHALVDEIDTLPKQKATDVWNKIIGRNRQRVSIDGNIIRNKIAVGTTPEGYNFVYDKWKKAPTPGYRMIKAKTTDNTYLPPGYVQTLYETYPDNLVEAYINGEFVNLTGNSIYHKFDRNLHNIDLTFETFQEFVLTNQMAA